MADITGIIVNTQVRAPNVPANLRAEIVIPQGGSATVRMHLIYASSAPVPVSQLKAETAPRLVVKARQFGAAKALSLDGVWDRLTNRWIFTVPATKTKNIMPGRYCYDVWVTMSDDGREQVVPVSAFVITASEQVN